MPVSGVYKIKGVGDVITGRIEQGQLTPNTMVLFAPSQVGGKVFSIEMHHKTVPKAGPGDNVGVNVKGLDKDSNTCYFFFLGFSKNKLFNRRLTCLILFFCSS